MIAKSASAATAVLGCAGYHFYTFDFQAGTTYPLWIPAAGLFGCLFLAFWIEPAIWISGLILLGMGLIWHTVAKRSRAKKS